VFDASSHPVKKILQLDLGKIYISTFLFKSMIKHEITDEDALEILQTVHNIYTTCGVAKNYSDVVSTAIDELRGEMLSVQHLTLCLVKNINEHLTFPAMASWKKRAQFLLIHDEFHPLDFSYNDWKKHVKIQDYIDFHLQTAPTRKIEHAPDKKTVIVDDEERATILYFQEKFNYETVDKTISYILQQTKAWRLVNFISRLIDATATLGEMSLMRPFGGFIFCLGEQRDSNNIQIISEFFPYVYNLNFASLINEVNVNVKSK